MEWTLHKYVLAVYIPNRSRPYGKLLINFFFWRRYVFHWDSKTFWPNMLHFMVHGYHHIMPMDPKRLVFPPPGTAVIAYLVYSLISTVRRVVNIIKTNLFC
jgi:hypothetical protein